MTNLEKTLQDFANDFELLLKNKAYVADLIATGELMNTLEVSSYYVNNNLKQNTPMDQQNILNQY